ncbi:MAG: hypothetical protein JKY65_25810 [Planctomycetes bacterium]|nr:hypothetical protein [Planctomycetota bacterium]
MSNSHWPDPRYPHPLSHLPGRLPRHTAETALGCELGSLEALVWKEVRAQALRNVARSLQPRRRPATLMIGAAGSPHRMRRRRRADV